MDLYGRQRLAAEKREYDEKMKASTMKDEDAHEDVEWQEHKERTLGIARARANEG